MLERYTPVRILGESLWGGLDGVVVRVSRNPTTNVCRYEVEFDGDPKSRTIFDQYEVEPRESDDA